MNPTSQQESTLLRLLQYILPFKGWLFTSIVCMAGYNLFAAAPAFYLKDIIDSLAYSDDLQLKNFIIVGIGIVIVFSCKGVFFFGQTYSMGLMIQKLLSQIRRDVYNHILHLSFSFYARSKTGDLTSRFTNDLQIFQNTLAIAIAGPFRDVPQIFLMLGIMVYRSWQLALMTLLIIPIAFFFIRLFGKHNQNAVTERQESFGELTTMLIETITGIRIVKAFGMEKYEQERFESADRRLYKTNMRTVLVASYSNPIIEIIGAIAGATIVCYGGYLIDQNQITPGDFASFLASFFMLNIPMKSINGFNLKLQEGVAAIHRIFEIMDIQSEIQNAPNARKLESFHENIEIHIDEFRYDAEEKIALRKIDLEVIRGEIIAFVGSSGAGKTTLIHLLPRFYDVTKGSIRIDGIDIREIDLKSLRNLISVVTQDTILFNDTIANNITYGHLECSKEKMVNAAKAANAHQFIQNFPQGYDTLIGEKGILLSGGEKQRLSIARAIIKDAPILILDEATSALDNESEIEVQEALDHLMQNRTTFVIAHRLSTIRHATKICVLEQGKIIEMGTHDELLQKDGRYEQLHKMQFRGE